MTSRLEWFMKNELNDLKDRCWNEGTLDEDKIKRFELRIYTRKTQGYDVKLYEDVLELMYDKINKSSHKVQS